MWIVRLALRRPYTVGVAAILIFILGILSLQDMLIDIFPVIDLPVVGVVWNYPGLSAEEMEKRIVFLSERAISTTVNGVARIESDSIPGIGILRVYFQQGVPIGSAIAQISSVLSTALRSMPPGMTAPIVIQFNAANVPVAQLTLSSDTLSEEKIFDYALNFIRVKLFTIPGLATPAPYGGKSRQINVEIDPRQLSAKRLSPTDVSNALTLSNIILPAGTARIGGYEYNVQLNSSPKSIKEFEKIPVKVVGNVPIMLGEVARIRDAFADQTNIVRVNGKRAAYLNILKKSDASTLRVVQALKNILPEVQALAPKGLNMRIDFDQSTFVVRAVKSVVQEAVISSLLVSLMVLFFLGSWRSVIVICTSIPLSILVGIIGLYLTGNSINIMTLSGLSLAIGMLVDDATVEVENIHRNRAEGRPLMQAILHGAEQIALPAIMATLAICIVFFPVVLLTGPAKYLFTPMALSVVFSMLASYVLSRTLVPVFCRMLLGAEKHEVHAAGTPLSFREGLFASLQDKYGRLLETVLANRRFVLGICGAVILLSAFLPFVVGTDFFPTTDTGLMKLHFRAPPGVRIEQTEILVAQAETEIRKLIPAAELRTINSNIGIPTSFNMAFVPTNSIAGMDAELLIALSPEHHSTERYMQAIRRRLAVVFPTCVMYFQPADIVSQVLNFGLSAPLDVQVVATDVTKAYEVAKDLRERMHRIPGIADANIKQVFDYPTLRLSVDRVRAARLGFSQRDVANSMLIALSSSSLIAPSFFLNPVNNVNYAVAVKVPLVKLASVRDLLLSPITTAAGTPEITPDLGNGETPSAPGAPLPETLGNLAHVTSESTMNSVSHFSVQRELDVTANIEGRDLGGVMRDLRAQIKEIGVLPVGMAIKIRGQSEVMDDAFGTLGVGLILAITLVYLLMVVLFQSWLDPFIVLTAVPGALVGILWALLLTNTTINVVSFMGSIMAVGIAASNSILLVSYANDARLERPMSALQAAYYAGITRLRPVLMTALAMIIGMFPTALGLGEGGEQNAPLGRAVIGGLVVATFVTLLVVPVIYSYLRRSMPTRHLLDQRLNEGKDTTPHGVVPHAV